MGVKQRVDDIEAELEAHRRAIWRRILAQLTDEELRALTGPAELWEDLSDDEIVAIARGDLPEPDAIEAYESPQWAKERIWELARLSRERLLPDVKRHRRDVEAYRIIDLIVSNLRGGTQR